MITDKLKQLVAGEINTRINAGTGRVGQGGNSTNPSNNTLDVPLITGIATTVSQSTSDGNVIDVKLSVAGTTLNSKTIREVGLFDSSSNMLQRINFDAIGPIASDATLEIFITMEVE